MEIINLMLRWWCLFPAKRTIQIVNGSHKRKGFTISFGVIKLTKMMPNVRLFNEKFAVNGLSLQKFTVYSGIYYSV